jgi:hypothetical protein
MIKLSTVLGSALNDEVGKGYLYCEGTINEQTLFQLTIRDGKHILDFYSEISEDSFSYEDIMQLLDMVKT